MLTKDGGFLQNIEQLRKDKSALVFSWAGREGAKATREKKVRWEIGPKSSKCSVTMSLIDMPISCNGMCVEPPNLLNFNSSVQLTKQTMGGGGGVSQKRVIMIRVPYHLVYRTPKSGP